MIIEEGEKSLGCSGAVGEGALKGGEGRRKELIEVDEAEQREGLGVGCVS